MNNENQISIFKKEKRDYRFIAYKHKIDDREARNIQKNIQSEKWLKGEPKEQKPDYKFYFNHPASSEKIVIYYIYIEKEIVTIQPENEDVFLTLNKKDSKELLGIFELVE